MGNEMEFNESPDLKKLRQLILEGNKEIWLDKNGIGFRKDVLAFCKRNRYKLIQNMIQINPMYAVDFDKKKEELHQDIALLKKMKRHNLDAVLLIDQKISQIIKEYKHLISMKGVNKWRYG